MISREQLERRLAALVARHQVLLGELKIAEGMLKECQHWIAQEAAPSAKKEGETAPPVQTDPSKP